MLPKDTIQLLKARKAIENNFLAFHRFAYSVKEKGKGKIKPHKKPNSLKCDKEKIYSKLLELIQYRQEKISKLYSPTQRVELTYKPTDKLLIGIGGLSPYSNHFTTMLHALYGIPYIPASAIKGVVRHYWIHEEFCGSEEEAVEDKLFVSCFGKATNKQKDEGMKGKLIFFDAFPIKCYNLVDDVQTPHYQQYYRNKGNEEPTDDESPTPIKMKAIKNTTFKIMIGVSASDFSQKDLDDVRKIVKTALREYGIGAKTALGYGLGEVKDL